MRIRRRYALFLTVFAWMPSARADSPPAVSAFTLANGLEVVVIENHRVPAVSHMLWYRVGSADDPPGKSGLAHYHEHMMYQGTSSHPPGRYAEMIESRGGEQNAFTTTDATAYYATVAKADLPTVMALEADRMRALSPANAVAEKEKEVIIEERLNRIENNPEALMSEQMNAALFRHHPYRLPVIGWMREMRELSREDVIRFHYAWHRPGNAVLVLSGDITPAAARALAETYYGRLAGRQTPPRRWNEEPPQNAVRQLTLRHANVRQPMWARYYAVSSLGHGRKESALPLVVLSQLLGGGKTSRLYQELVKDRELASDVNADYDAFAMGPARFRIAVTPEPGVSMEDVGKAVDKALAAVREEAFDAEDLQRAKTLLKADAVYARDGLADMARIMGWIRMVGLPVDYFLHWPENIEKVTAKDIIAAGKSELLPEQSVTGWLLPEEKKAAP